MIEKRKAERVRVLGVKVDSIRVDRAINLTIRCLEKHKFEYIVFANTPAALAGKDGSHFQDYIDEAALVLPGDSNIEDAVEVKRWMEEGKAYQAEYFRRLFTKLSKQRASVYIMAEKEDQLSKIRNIMDEKYKRLYKEDILWQEDTSIDSMVNAINSLVPEVLFICAGHERMSQFLKEHGCKINAGLCFCMEEVVTDSDTDISEWNNATGIQRWLMETRTKMSRFLHDIVFKNKMKRIQQEAEAEEAENTFSEDRKEETE